MMCSNVGNSFTKTCMVASPYEQLVLLDELGFRHQNTFSRYAHMHNEAALCRVPVLLKIELVEDG